MKRIYIAGKLNDDAVGYLQNLHRMIALGVAVRDLGHAVFIPGLDALAGIVSGQWVYQDYFDNSQPWLEVADAVVVVPELWHTSKGTHREIVRAIARKIPVYIGLENFKKGQEYVAADW